MQMSLTDVTKGNSDRLCLFKQATAIKDCTTLGQGRGGFWLFCFFCLFV